MAKLALLLFLWTAPLPAQSVSISTWPNGSQALNQGWRMHAGDNSAWAQPAFDDSTWPSVSFGGQYNDGAGRRWYRLRVHLAASHPPLALMVTGGDGSFEVYANGQRLPGPALKSSLLITLPREEVIALPDLSGDVELAIRTDIPPTSMFVANRGAWRVQIGTRPAIAEAWGAALGERLNAAWPDLSIDVLLFFSGIPLLLLFWRQRDHREYLWLGIYLFVVSTGDAAFDLAVTGFVPFSLNWVWGDPTGYFSVVALIEFTFSFVGKRLNWAWRSYEVLLLALPLALNVPAWQGMVSRGFINLEESALMIPGSLALFVLLLVWYRRGYRETAWLIFPTFLATLSLAVIDLGIAASYLGWSRLARLSDPISIGVLSGLPLDPVNLLFLVAIGVVMFFRFTRVSEQQARAAAEFDAAREIQQRLVPLSLPPVAGCRIQAAYLPAEEVGGDFYQVLEQPGGATLIVIGDVSGKGLKAAMTGAVAIGALRTLAAEGLSPAALLTRLNRQILAAQDGGFVTSLVARIAPDGAVTLANAGHLAPYCDGEELAVPPGLPLGIEAGLEYSETTVNLAPGDTLTFLSDGIVEAQSATGELFGFDRTAAISTHSAEEIARAAQVHGQQDDITVLTLQFAPAEVLHA